MNPPPITVPDQPSTFEKPPAPIAPSVNVLPPDLPNKPFINGIPLADHNIPTNDRLVTRPSRPGNFYLFKIFKIYSKLYII